MWITRASRPPDRFNNVCASSLGCFRSVNGDWPFRKERSIILSVRSIFPTSPMPSRSSGTKERDTPILRDLPRILSDQLLTGSIILVDISDGSALRHLESGNRFQKLLLSAAGNTGDTEDLSAAAPSKDTFFSLSNTVLVFYGQSLDLRYAASDSPDPGVSIFNVTVWPTIMFVISVCICLLCRHICRQSSRGAARPRGQTGSQPHASYG